MSFSRSLTFRLTLAYGASTAALLIVISIVLIRVVASGTAVEDKEQIKEKLESIQSVFNNPNPDQHALNQEVVDEGADDVVMARVLNTQQQLLLQADFLKLIPINAFPKPSTLSDLHYLKYKVRGRKFLLASVYMTDVKGQRRIVQVAENIDSDLTFIRLFTHTLAALTVISSLVAMLLGFWVARRGLRPLNAITQAAERITVEHLHERLDAQQWPSELQTLAKSFDAMLIRLEESFQRLSQFSANLAHELRTPLHNLIGQSEVTLAQSRSVAEYQHVLGSNLEEYTRLATILDSLLFLARAESAQMALNKTSFDGRAMLDSLCNYQSMLAEELGIQLHCTGQAEIKADKELLRRAVNNLLSNALKHTPENGQVSLSIQDFPEESIITVQDNGQGIAPEYLAHLGQRFFRAGVTDTSGYGLGLAIVRSIVQLHGGRLFIDSQVGLGTTVHLHLPK